MEVLFWVVSYLGSNNDAFHARCLIPRKSAVVGHEVVFAHTGA